MGNRHNRLKIVLGIFFLIATSWSQTWEITQQINGEYHLDRNIRLLSVEDSLLWVSSTDYIGNQESPLLVMERLSNRYTIPITNIVTIKKFYLPTERPEATGAFLGFMAAIPISTLISQNSGGTNVGVGGLINDIVYDNFLIFLITTPLGAWLGHQVSLHQNQSKTYDLTELTMGEKTTRLIKILEDS